MKKNTNPWRKKAFPSLSASQGVGGGVRDKEEAGEEGEEKKEEKKWSMNREINRRE